MVSTVESWSCRSVWFLESRIPIGGWFPTVEEIVNASTLLVLGLIILDGLAKSHSKITSLGTGFKLTINL